MTQIEQIALDYLWPYRMNKDIRPIDIMRLPPDDFQGWHIEISGETISLTGENETHTLNLKKLIVQIDKELDGRAPATPRELAKMLIHTSVECHEDLKHLADSHQGMGWYGYNVSIGGYIHKDGKSKYMSCWHIVVDEFEGEECSQVFDLKEIYHEIEVELKQGYALVQPTLF